MSEIRVLRAQVALITQAVEASLADITDEESVRSPIPGVNGMNCILGHLVQVNAGILELLGRPADPPSAARARYTAGGPPDDDTDAWTISELREAFLRQAALIDQVQVDAPPELLAAPPPSGFREALASLARNTAAPTGSSTSPWRWPGSDRPSEPPGRGRRTAAPSWAPARRRTRSC